MAVSMNGGSFKGGLGVDDTVDDRNPALPHIPTLIEVWQ